MLYSSGYDREGRPVIYCRVRHFHPSLLADETEVALFFVFFMDALARRSEANGRDEFTMIADLAGFTMNNFSLPIVKVGISILQNHYPERLGKVFVVNSPLVFKAAWRLVLPLLDDRTKSKLQILGSDYQSVIHDCIAPDVLAKDYGGTAAAADSEDPIIRDDLGKDFYSSGSSEVKAPAASVPMDASMTATRSPGYCVRERRRDRLRLFLSSHVHPFRGTSEEERRNRLVGLERSVAQVIADHKAERDAAQQAAAQARAALQKLEARVKRAEVALFVAISLVVVVSAFAMTLVFSK